MFPKEEKERFIKQAASVFNVATENQLNAFVELELKHLNWEDSSRDGSIYFRMMMPDTNVGAMLDTLYEEIRYANVIFIHLTEPKSKGFLPVASELVFSSPLYEQITFRVRVVQFTAEDIEGDIVDTIMKSLVVG